MKKVVKQVLGVDVAQNELVCCFGKMHDDFTPELISHRSFVNSPKGFESLLTWVVKLSEASVSVRYVMEATGIYHESFAYFLHNQGFDISIILPNKISNYARTLDVKTVTDRTASEAIALFGLERKLDNWNPPKGIYKKLQQLSRERSQLVNEQTVIKNQLHAEKAEAFPHKNSIKRANKRLLLIKMQIQDIKNELEELIKSNDEVKEIVMLLCSIPGIGFITAATVLGETNGFNLIRNKRQLTSYAGLDVKEKQSGISIRGKATISKKGNKQLRKAMHLPALAAIRYDERYKAIFARLVSKHGVKMKAVVAVQRKLLEMTFTIFKSKTKFDKNYFNVAKEIIEQDA
jgi:transposase